jgi:hypothetical protein
MSKKKEFLEFLDDRFKEGCWDLADALKAFPDSIGSGGQFGYFSQENSSVDLQQELKEPELEMER